MTFCKGGCGKTTSGPHRLRCRACAGKLLPVKSTKVHGAFNPGSKQWNQTPSRGPKTVFGKATKPAACGHSYWADKVCQEDPALFYAANRERALALRGQGHSE